MNIRKARPEELERVEEIYAVARRYMKETGNPNQWQDKYPLTQWLIQDMEKGNLYVCEAENELVGVFYFSTEPDPDYEVMENGSWQSTAPHGVIHRVASDGSKKGIFTEILNYCRERAANIRMDTHEDNKVMQHVLEKHGFVRRGIVYVHGESPRIAYERIESALEG